MHSGSHKEVSLVYFSTFEPIDLTPGSIMQRAGVPMLYDSASNPRVPCLYICPVANVLGRAPLISCFIGANSHPTIPYRFKDDRRIGHASADTQRDRGNCSRLYEVKICIWILAKHRYRRMVRRSWNVAISTPISALNSMIPDIGVHPMSCLSDIGIISQYTDIGVTPISCHFWIRYRVIQCSYFVNIEPIIGPGPGAGFPAAAACLDLGMINLIMGSHHLAWRCKVIHGGSLPTRTFPLLQKKK
jgi:hypothetical protein